MTENYSIFCMITQIKEYNVFIFDCILNGFHLKQFYVVVMIN